MNYSDDKILQRDMKYISDNYDFPELRGRCVMITGATGLIGMHLVRALDAFNQNKDYDTTIIIAARNEEKVREVFSDLLDKKWIRVFISDINSPLSYPGEVDYIIHGASMTASKDFVCKPVETIKTALTGTENVMTFARNKAISGVVYLSSLEVYGTPDGKNETIKEDDYGYIEPLNVRSSYSEGKRMAECLVSSYSSEYEIPAVIVRLSQTFGTGVDYNDGRVFAQFIRSAMEKKDIVLHTAGNTVRTYLYTRDAVTGILTALTRGKVREAYNITNKETAVSIREMAELVKDTFKEADIDVRVEIPEDVSKLGYNPEMVIRLNTEKLEALGWRAEVSLREMFINMRDSIEARYNE